MTTYVFDRGSQYGEAEFLGSIDVGCEDLTEEQIETMRSRYVEKVNALIECYDSTLIWYPSLSEVWGVVGETKSDPLEFREWWQDGSQDGRWENALLEAYEETVAV